LRAENVGTRMKGVKIKSEIKFNPILKAGLIRGIGREFYYKSHPLTKVELFQMALKDFYMWQERTFGSRHKYNLHIIKRNGWKSVKEYMDEWARTMGLPDYAAYNKKYRKKRSIEIKLKGLCSQCKIKIENKKHSRCDQCLEKHRIKERDRWRKNNYQITTIINP